MPAGHAEAPGRQRRVFISYASHDAPLAQKVCSALEAAGFLCWIAPRNVVPGTLYAEGIVRALDESTIVVLILSEQAVASAHVGRELGLIVPGYFIGVQAFDLTGVGTSTYSLNSTLLPGGTFLGSSHETDNIGR